MGRKRKRKMTYFEMQEAVEAACIAWTEAIAKQQSAMDAWKAGGWPEQAAYFRAVEAAHKAESEYRKIARKAEMAYPC